MKTIEQERRLTAARTEYFKTIAADLRELGRAGLTPAQAAKNLNAAVAAIRDEEALCKKEKFV